MSKFVYITTEACYWDCDSFGSMSNTLATGTWLKQAKIRYVTDYLKPRHKMLQPTLDVSKF